jgi:hypothetical protein
MRMRKVNLLLSLLLCLAGCAAGGDMGGGGGSDDDGDDDGPGPATGDAGPVAEGALIDDLDDGNAGIHETDGRQGSWYAFHDGTAGATMTPDAAKDFVPAMGGAGGSAYAAVIAGSGFKEWGAGMGLDLNNPGDPMGGPGKKNPHDASKWQGITFKARGNAPVRVSLLTTPVVATTDGGECVPSMTEGMMCEDGHGKQLSLTSSWKEYRLTWAELKQAGWGKKASFDPKLVTSVLFIVPQNAMFDVAVDDVAFW